MKTNRQSCSKLHLEEEWKEVALHWLKVRTTKTKHFSTTKHRCNDTMDLIDTNSMCTGRKHFYMIKHKTRCIFKPYFDTIAKSFESYLSYIVSYFTRLEGTMRNISCQRNWYIKPAVAILHHPNHTVSNHWNWQIKIYQQVFAELDEFAMSQIQIVWEVDQNLPKVLVSYMGRRSTDKLTAQHGPLACQVAMFFTPHHHHH